MSATIAQSFARFDREIAARLAELAAPPRVQLDERGDRRRERIAAATRYKIRTRRLETLHDSARGATRLAVEQSSNPLRLRGS